MTIILSLRLNSERSDRRKEGKGEGKKTGIGKNDNKEYNKMQKEKPITLYSGNKR